MALSERSVRYRVFDGPLFLSPRGLLRTVFTASVLLLLLARIFDRLVDMLGCCHFILEIVEGRNVLA